MRRFFLLTLSLAALVPAAAQTTGKAAAFVEEIASVEPVNTCFVGVKATKASGEVIVDFNGCKKMIPASNTKLISTGLALNILGGDYRFETVLACSGEIADSTLNGDLYIIGGGDPTTGSDLQPAEGDDSVLEKWRRIILDAGISHITGRIIGDPRGLDGYPIHMDWCYEDIGTDYGASPTGLNFFENQKLLKVFPGDAEGDPAFVMPDYPPTPWMNFHNFVKTSAEGTGSDLRYLDTDMAPSGILDGYIQTGHKGRTLYASNLFGAYTCAFCLFRHLNENGVSVDGGFADIDMAGRIREDLYGQTLGEPAETALKRIGSTFSPELREIAKRTNHESDNFMAETLLRLLGRTLTGSACYDSARAALPVALSTVGILPPYNARQMDGSGLARSNFIAPEFFVDYLLHMLRSRSFDDFLTSLPQPGSGTLTTRLQKAPQELRERVHMKSGSMGGVCSYSGYILPPDGNPDNTVAFSIIFNNYTMPISDVRTIIDAIIMQIATDI